MCNKVNFARNKYSRTIGWFSLIRCLLSRNQHQLWATNRFHHQTVPDAMPSMMGLEERRIRHELGEKSLQSPSKPHMSRPWKPTKSGKLKGLCLLFGDGRLTSNIVQGDQLRPPPGLLGSSSSGGQDRVCSTSAPASSISEAVGQRSPSCDVQEGITFSTSVLGAWWQAPRRA